VLLPGEPEGAYRLQVAGNSPTLAPRWLATLTARAAATPMRAVALSKPDGGLLVLAGFSPGARVSVQFERCEKNRCASGPRIVTAPMNARGETSYLLRTVNTTVHGFYRATTDPPLPDPLHFSI